MGNVMNLSSGGKKAKLQSKTVSASASSSVSVVPDSGYDGLSGVTVQQATLQRKTVTPSSAQQIITADDGYFGLERVTVSAMPYQAGAFTSNGTCIQTFDSTNGIKITIPSTIKISNVSRVIISANPNYYLEDGSDTEAILFDLIIGESLLIDTQTHQSRVASGTGANATVSGTTLTVSVNLPSALTYNLLTISTAKVSVIYT